MSDPVVSVIVPAYNCASTIVQCIQSILSQSYSNPFELIVVDDGSTDTTAQQVKSFKNISYMYQQHTGPAVARNRGAKAARGEFVLFTDADCIADKKWIENIMRSFTKADIAGVAGSYGIANPGNKLANAIHKEIIFRHKNLMPQFPKSFGSYNFGARKKVFDQLHGFDETYRCASGEDNDLSYRMLKAHYKILFNPEALVYHFHPTQLLRYLTGQFHHGFWRAKMYQNFPQMMKGDDYTFWKDIIEVPLVYCIFLAVGLSFIGVKFLGWIGLSASVFLLSIQLIFSFRFQKGLQESIYYSLVMFLRSFFRTFGFSSGFFHFFLKNSSKKVK